MPYWCSHSVNFNIYHIVKNDSIWKISSFYCYIRLVSHLRYLYSFYHSRATRAWSVCNEMYQNVFRYAYLTFQTQIHLYKQYIFDTNIIQSEYAFLFPFSIYGHVPECHVTFGRGRLHNVWWDPHIDHKTSCGTISNVSWHIPFWGA